MFGPCCTRPQDHELLVNLEGEKNQGEVQEEVRQDWVFGAAEVRERAVKREANQAHESDDFLDIVEGGIINREKDPRVEEGPGRHKHGKGEVKLLGGKQNGLTQGLGSKRGGGGGEAANLVELKNNRKGDQHSPFKNIH